MVVVSTGFNHPTKERCLESVRSQSCELRGGERLHIHPPTHVYIEASAQVPRLGSVENFYNAVHELHKDDIVVALDGDDWLFHDRVLAKVQAMHDAGAWLTYGSFVYDIAPPFGGRRGFCREYQDENYRVGPWGASHLKTFRAGLFHRIARCDLMVGDGSSDWLFVRDLAIMFPMLEMAGRARSRYCDEILCVYETKSARTRTSEEVAWEARDDKLIRGRPRYALLEGSY